MSDKRQINIIGAGLAGLSAAITLAENKIPSNLFSLQPSERAQSVLAEGGINGALNTMGEDDAPQYHREDTLRAGCELADEEAVRGLTEEAPQIIRYLEERGVAFNTRDGEILQRNFGGQKKKRTAYARSSTGKIIMTALIDEARKYEAEGWITRYPHHAFCELILQDAVSEGGGWDQPVKLEERRSKAPQNRETRKFCCGVSVRDTYTDSHLFFTGPVILAVGGMNGVFLERTTGTTMNSGDALAQAFSQGVRLGNLEMIQYHPTTIGISGKRCLVTEAARGEGGRLYVMRDGKPWYFMEEKYPELGNLMPRDVVSREITFVKQDPACGDEVYLDMTGLSEEVWKKRLPDLRAELIHYLGLDPKTSTIPVDPGIHYFMGGIHVDREHCTNIEGLYAAGECCDQYHGANRLGGNSMLGAIYGGRVAARTVMKRIADVADVEIDADMGRAESQQIIQALEKEQQEVSASPDLILKIRDILMDAMGIVRNEAKLLQAKKALAELLQRGSFNAKDRNRIYLAQALVMSASFRRESRGAHYREDFPERNDDFKGIVVAELTGQEKVEIGILK